MKTWIRNLTRGALALHVAALAVALAGCGERSSAPAPQATAPATTQAKAQSPGEAAAPAQRVNAYMQQLYDAARKEGGKVVYWSPTESNLESEVATRFNATFPDVKIVPFSIKPGNAVERIISEAQAGRVSVDLLSTSVASGFPLLERDLVAPFDGFDQMPKPVQDSLLVDGKFINSYNLYFVFGYNKDAIAPDLLPHSWDDLLNPKLKGKIAIEARAMPFGYLGLKWGKEKLGEYIDKLLAQKPFFVKGGNTVADQVASGEAPIGVGTYSDNIELLKNQGAPVGATIPNILAVSGFGNMLIKGAAHPNGAKLYAAWMASEEGQQALGKVLHRSSLSSDLALQREIKAKGAEVVFDDADTYKLRKEMEAFAAKRLGVMR